MLSYKGCFLKVGVLFHTFFSETKSVTPNFCPFLISLTEYLFVAKIWKKYIL